MKKKTTKRARRNTHKKLSREKKRWSLLVLVVVLVLLLVVVSYLAYESHSRAERLSKEFTLVKAQLTSLQERVQELSLSLKNASQEIQNQRKVIASLEKNNTDLQKQLEEKTYKLKVKEKELEKKNEQLSALQGDINRTLAELEEYEERLNERMQWFQDNSNINSFDDYYSFEKMLRSKCLQTAHGTCSINLACLSFVNTHEKGLSYKTDEETSQESDALQNLESILMNEGGDCEDFSLLFVSEINYLRGFCRSLGSDDLEFTGFVPGNGVFYVENSKAYYLANAEARSLPEEYNYYYIACGNFPEAPNVETNSDVVGHCVVAFSDEPITSSEDVYNSLRKAILVEPQTGEVLYDLRTDTEMYVPLNSTVGRKYFLYLVITNSDAYEFNEKSGDWKGFGDFLNFINEQKERLNPNAFIS